MMIVFVEMRLFSVCSKSLRVSVKGIEGVWKVFGRCFEGVWKVFGR